MLLKEAIAEQSRIKRTCKGMLPKAVIAIDNAIRKGTREGREFVKNVNDGIEQFYTDHEEELRIYQKLSSIEVATALVKINRGKKDIDLVTNIFHRVSRLNKETGDIVTTYEKYPDGPGCGADLNKVILSHPFDGQQYVAKCPTCENSFSFRTARYHIEAE